VPATLQWALFFSGESDALKLSLCRSRSSMVAPTVAWPAVACVVEAVQRYVRVQAPRVVLEHVRIINGTGSPAVDDQNVVVEAERYGYQAGSDAPVADGVTVLNLVVTRRCRHWGMHIISLYCPSESGQPVE